MEIEVYLKKYDRDELKLLKWLKSNGANLLVAMNVILSYAKEDRQFESGSDLDHAILNETIKEEIDPYRDFIEAKEKLSEATQAAMNIVSLQHEFQQFLIDSKELFGKKQPWYKRLWQLMQKPL